MRYREILELNPYFQPAYDLTNEVGGYWKQFVPNSKFYTILSDTLNSLESNKAEEKRSLWLQGTYGTGKSHATAVVKHLLSDPWDDISDFVDNMENTQIQMRLMNFREGHRVFPVVLSGTSTITDNRTFALRIETAVKDALKDHGIEVLTESDFEKMIRQISENTANIEWDRYIEDSELCHYVQTKEDLLSKLQQGDFEILRILEDVSSEKGIHFSLKEISQWLVEVSTELEQKGFPDGLMIFWDEFTSVLELPKSGVLLTELQRIAELSVNKGVYLFVVSHRRPYQTNISKGDIEKILGRFKILDYSMEMITTYHILNAAIKKTEFDVWDSLKEENVQSVMPVINRIAVSEDSHVRRSIKNLFPIHPYTAYLMTFIARNVGSTERSIFKFLYDWEKGFKRFIEDNPGENGRKFLLADSLWDFFYDEFERTNAEKVGSILEKYRLYADTVGEKGGDFLTVFKGILLLNILNKLTRDVGESSLISPSAENIKGVFMGCVDGKEIDEILSFVDEQQMIDKTPDGLYLIASSNLPYREIEEEKHKVESEFKEIQKILSSSHIDEIKRSLTGSIIRVSEVVLFDIANNEPVIRRKLENDFRESFTLHIALFLGRHEQDLASVREILQRLVREEAYKDVIFLVSDVLFEEKLFGKFLEYMARERVADKHSYMDERNLNRDYANKVLEEWLNRVRSGYLEWFFQKGAGKELFTKMGNFINEAVSREIFKFGLENVATARNINVWKPEKSKKSTEIFLFADNRDDLEKRTKSNPWVHLREILKDSNGEYIVGSDLSFKENVSENHPLKRMHDGVEEALKTAKKEGNFNLADALNFLRKPPFGLFQNKINYAAAGFLLRDYVGNLYEAGTGIPLSKEKMRDKIEVLLQYWEKGKGKEKLELRVGTEEDRKLTRILTDIFKLDSVESLNDVRWKIREWIKDAGFPLWAYKVSDSANERTKEAVDVICEFVQSIDRELSYEKIKEYLDVIDGVKNDLKYSIVAKDHLEGLFKKWVLSLENLSLSESDFGKILDYLQESMQEEVASWNEEKVRATVQEWYIQKREEVTKEEIEGLMSFQEMIKTLSDRNNFPVWIYKYAANVTEAEVSAIDSVIDLLGRPLPDTKLTRKEMDAYKETIVAFKDIDKSVDNGNRCFLNWLKTIDGVTVREDDANDIRAFLREEIPSDVSLWSEAEARMYVMKWFHDSPPPPDEVEIVETRIRSWDGDKAKDILLRLARENKQVLEFIRQFLEE